MMNKNKIKDVIIREGKKQLKSAIYNQIFSTSNKKKLKDFVLSKVAENINVSCGINNLTMKYQNILRWLSENNTNINKYIYIANNGMYILHDGEYKIIYKKHLLLINCETLEKISYSISIDIFGKEKEKIENEIFMYINRIKQNNDCKENKFIDYMRYPDDRFISVLGRNMKTIFSEQIQDIINIISNWNSDRDLYYNHGLTFKTGIILHGVPGTGKTSIVKGIATHFNMQIVSVNLCSISYEKLSKFSQELRLLNNTIVLLEEIDLKGSKDIEEKTQELLTILDGVDGVNNMIFIATTNYINDVDVRIKRPGRFDNIIEITNINKETAIKMCESFNVNPENVLHNYNLENEDKFEKYNPSKLQKEILNEYRIQKSKIVKEDIDIDIKDIQLHKEDRVTMSNIQYNRCDVSDCTPVENIFSISISN